MYAFYDENHKNIMNILLTTIQSAEGHNKQTFREIDMIQSHHHIIAFSSRSIKLICCFSRIFFCSMILHLFREVRSAFLTAKVN